MTLRDDIAAAALTYEGTPFHHQERLPGPKGGMDCAGVVICSHRAVGLKCHDHRTYGRRPNPRELIAHLEVSFRQITEEEAGFGDVVVFYLSERRGEPMPQHFGIMVPRKHAPHGIGLLHAYADHETVQFVDFDVVWQERIHSYWRHRDLEYLGEDVE